LLRAGIIVGAFTIVQFSQQKICFGLDHEKVFVKLMRFMCKLFIKTHRKEGFVH